MSSLAAVSNGLQAAFQLARGRADGLRLVETDLAGARRSFWALLLCLPAELCLLLMSWLDAARDKGASGVTLLRVPAHLGHLVVLDLLLFVTGWLGYAVLSHRIATEMGRAALWPRFIAAWNWCSVAQIALQVAAGLVGLSGAPDWLSETAELVVFGWALWLEWFATRLALDISPLAAGMLVLLDTLIGNILFSMLPPG